MMLQEVRGIIGLTGFTIGFVKFYQGVVLFMRISASVDYIPVRNILPLVTHGYQAGTSSFTYVLFSKKCFASQHKLEGMMKTECYFTFSVKIFERILLITLLVAFHLTELLLYLLKLSSCFSHNMCMKSGGS